MPSLTNLRQKTTGSQVLPKEEKKKKKLVVEYSQQAERLGLCDPTQEDDSTGSTRAVDAKFITGQDPVIQTANGGRLPAVPVEEAAKLNRLKDQLEGREPVDPIKPGIREAKDGTIHGAQPENIGVSEQSSKPNAPLSQALPQPKTNPLFPPLAIYGPPSFMRNVQCMIFRISSAILSFCFLLVIILGAVFTSIPTLLRRLWFRLTFRDPDADRPFIEEERRRQRVREEAQREWRNRNRQKMDPESNQQYQPLEGGKDPLVCDIAYYARRVGLDCEIFKVTTEDGFIIELWHIYDPQEYTPASSAQRAAQSPDIFPMDGSNSRTYEGPSRMKAHQGNKRYPVLLIHGLLQSAGAYCSNDDDSLAFFLAKSGYDVWLGNNRCGFKPEHNLLEYKDPRMWAWNIRQMGVMDLPALISRVLSETGFEKLGLVAHSQGTTQTLVALAKEQRPDIGSKISVFCALAPAAYAGPLIGKMYFKFMRIISPGMFRAMFGIHAFIPFMMTMHSLLPGHLYGAMGYLVFGFLFNWSDTRWDRGLRDRMFQFAPVYVSAESMRWWLGRECFARQKCILATREEALIEDREDGETHRMKDEKVRRYFAKFAEKTKQKAPKSSSEKPKSADGMTQESKSVSQTGTEPTKKSTSGQEKTILQPLKSISSSPDSHRFSWYNSNFPPLAMWVAGSDELVDGKRLLRRFERGREPEVEVVHAKIIDSYEHLDVIWAMDMIEQVGKEVREVIWQTMPAEAKAACRVPIGCESNDI